MLSIDEAIVALKNTHGVEKEWLEALKDHRERKCNHINEALYDKGYSDGYNKAIDESIEIVKGNYRMEALEKLEQLKEGGLNE